MTKILNYSRTPIIVDTDNLTVKRLDNVRWGIEGMFMVPEDSTMHWENSTGDQVYDQEVHKGDIVITFYDSKYGKDFVVVHSDDWNALINNYKEKAQKEKEDWAARKCQDCGDCDK